MSGNPYISVNKATAKGDAHFSPLHLLSYVLIGAGFWLIAAGHATPAAVVARFVSAWSAVDAGDDTGFLSASFADRPELAAG